MSVDTSLKPTFDVVQRQVEQFHPQVTASFLYGYMVAKILQGEWQPELLLEDLLAHIKFEKEKIFEFASTWNEMFRFSFENVSASFLDLDSLLPNDDFPLSMRLFCLVDLVNGVLKVLSMENLQQHFQQTEGLEEILQDFQAITQMSSDEDDTNENEGYYVEIEEYIRIGIMYLSEHAFALINLSKQQAAQIHH